MVVIDDRLLTPDTDQDVAENFNRVLASLDEIFGIVADLDASQLFKVTFDSNGGSEVATQYVVDNDVVTQPEDPTQEGYVFQGWYLFDDLYDFETPVGTHLNLTAHWDVE
jgi:uncharacterized repeat protein (TIGR02543 family)